MTEPRGAALVTGAARRIGRVLALNCAEAGYDVALHCRVIDDDAESVAAEIRALGRRAALFTRDLRKERDNLEREWEQAESELAEVQRQLANTATYDDPSKVTALTREHEQLKDHAAQLMEKYDTTLRRIARKEAEIE